MEYVRQVDFQAIANAGPGERLTQRLIDNDNGTGTCTIGCIRTPPGGGSPEGAHTHEVDQIFYVVSGVMSLEIEGKPYEAGPGSIVLFPAGVPHRNWNAGSEPTVHLNIAAPAPDPSKPFAQRVG